MAVELSNREDEHRYEARVESALAGLIAYRLNGERILFTHTEVDPAYEGQGLGSKLAKFALDDVRERGMLAVPLCPFIRSYIERHPDYLDLVAEEMRCELTTEVKTDA